MAVEGCGGTGPRSREIYAEGLATGHAIVRDRTAQLGGLPRRATCDDRELVAHDDVRRHRLGGALACVRPLRLGGVAEDSVYVAEARAAAASAGYLLTQLVRRAEEAGIWTIQAGIFPENTASVALHHACGFRTVGVRERLGKYHGVWRDVLLLERRSGSIT